MKCARSYTVQLSSKPCSTCEDPEGSLDAALLPAENLEEELKQISDARKLTGQAIQAHLTSQHSQTRGARLAA
jgi:hypothetical protein